MIADVNPYALLAVNGFFTGLGVVTAQWFYDRMIKDRRDRAHKRAQELLKNKEVDNDKESTY